jgi:uncharacterized membrane protein YfhO
MALDVSAPWPSYLRVLETWDPGWRVEVDGAPAPLIPAYDAFMAVPVAAGEHRVRLTFHTPGARAGLGISGVSLALLLVLSWRAGGATARNARSIDSPGPA